jgi:VWFA-related protein
MRLFVRAFAATVLLSSFAAAQQPAEAKPEALQVNARLIIVPTVVRDRHGALVKDLARDSFALTVDGKPQPIRYFDHDNDVPLTLGLLIDTSMSQREVLGDEQTASAAFLDKMLAPDRDKAFLIQFAHDINLLQDVTSSRPKLQEALKQLDADTPTFGHGHDRGSGGGGTTLYDAVFLASDEVAGKQQGRRALILLTDGDDNGSLKTLPKAIEAAQRADTILYAIYYHSDHDGDHGGGGSHGSHGGGFPGGGGSHGGGFPGGGGGYPGGGGGGYPGGGHPHADGKKVLEQMCLETGGRMFEVSKKETVDGIYTEIGDELRSQYRLGFTPSAEAASEGYHQIDLTLTGPAAKAKDRVQTRDGYYQK